MTLYVATQRLHRLQHLIRGSVLGRLECQPVHDMTASPEDFVFVTGSCINVDANSGEWPRQRLCSHTDAIGKLSDLVELSRILLLPPYQR